MDHSEVEALLNMDIGPYLTVKPGVGHMLEDIKRRINDKNQKITSKYISFVITVGFDIFLYYGKTHEIFYGEQGIAWEDILLSGSVYPPETGIENYGVLIRSEGVIDRFLSDQRPVDGYGTLGVTPANLVQAWLRFRQEMISFIRNLIQSLRTC